jgi:hypothetical protein
VRGWGVICPKKMKGVVASVNNGPRELARLSSLVVRPGGGRNLSKESEESGGDDGEQAEMANAVPIVGWAAWVHYSAVPAPVGESVEGLCCWLGCPLYLKILDCV